MHASDDMCEGASLRNTLQQRADDVSGGVVVVVDISGKSLEQTDRQENAENELTETVKQIESTNDVVT